MSLMADYLFCFSFFRNSKAICKNSPMYQSLSIVILILTIVVPLTSQARQTGGVIIDAVLIPKVLKFVTKVDLNG